MKPEKFIGIMLITLLLSCEMEEQTDQKLGEVSFRTNQHITNSSFDIEIFINGKKITTPYSDNKLSNTINEKFNKQLNVGVHSYEVKVHSYTGDPAKSTRGKFIIKENKKSEVFIDFKKYNSWI